MNLRSSLLAVAALSTMALSSVIAGAQAQPAAPVERARLAGVLPLDGELFHVQGIDLDADSLWVTSVDLKNRKGYIHQFDRKTGKVERRIELTDGERYHPGGISIDGDTIWVPVAEMKPNSSAIIEQLDRRTLKVLRRFPVADHIGCVAVAGDELIGGNWDSRLLYVFDKNGKRLRVAPNPSETRYQDMKFVDGALVGSGHLTPLSGTIDWLSWPALQLITSRHAGATDRQKPLTGEGMAVKGRNLYLLSEDGPSRLFHFFLTD